VPKAQVRAEGVLNNPFHAHHSNAGVQTHADDLFPQRIAAGE
jgi:hypothetical protein